MALLAGAVLYGGACSGSDGNEPQGGGAGWVVGGASAGGAGGAGGRAIGGGGSGGGAVDQGIDLGGGVTVSPSDLSAATTVTVRYQGALSDRQEVTLRYGFNGWNATPGASSQDDGTGNLDFFLEKPMRAAANGGFEAEIAVPADARAWHAVFWSGEGASRTWDNNQGQDYARGVPFPYIGPYLGYNAEAQPATGVVVSFHTGHRCKGRVEYGTTAALGEVASEASDNDTAHHVVLTGLSPDTEHHYRVACDDLVGEEVQRFQTAPNNATAWRFVVLGDMQDGGERGRWADVAQAVNQQASDAAFLLVAGDMAYNDRPGLWWTFFDKGRKLFASKPIIPTAGNHDTPGVSSSTDTRSFERMYPLDDSSGSPTYYRFAYGNAEFLALNSEVVGHFAVSGGDQYNWVEQTLMDGTPSRDWLFAAWHIPPYNAGARHYQEQGMFRDITGLFDGKVDWVFNGHEHLYQRTNPLRFNAVSAPSGKYGNRASDGVGYLIVPPAGNWPADTLIAHDAPKAYYRDRLAYPLVTPPSNLAPSEVGFVVVGLNQRTITITSYGLGTIEKPTALRVVDQLSYQKP